MAFDLYLDKERECIGNHEEGFFYLINENDTYPKLNWLWQNFYESPLISPSLANDLVHELIALRNEISNNSEHKPFISTIDRIIPFLSKAYKENKQITSSSD